MAEDTNLTNEGFLARFFQRDSDTLGRFSNTGLLMFADFHEWGDSYDPATGATGRIEGETYDAQTDSFEPNCTVGTPVFNGRLSGLWDCVERAWPEDIAAMYRAMRAAGFNAETMWEMYQSFRTQWCEALYNVDAMGYANTGRFDMAYGDKNEAMRQFFTARFRYLDSKYGANTSAPLEFRLWGNGKGIALRYYCPIYASMNWGAGGIIAERAITPGEPSYFPNPGVTFNETTVTCYNADLITEISTYTELPDGSRVEGGLEDLATRSTVSGLAGCRRLKKLVFDFSGREANTNLDGRVLDACKSVALRKMVVRNCPNVTGHADFKSQVIEEIDFRGTDVSGVTVPETDTLTILRYGENVTEIRLSHLGGLATLTADGVGCLGVISMHDCPKVDIRALLNEALRGTALREVSLTGIDWKSYPVANLEKLADLGAELTGSIALAAADNMSFALKRKCLEVWGDIDDEDNPLHISYTKRPVDIIRISGAGYFAEPGDYQLQVISDDPYANDFVKIEWEISANSYAEIDTLAGRVHVNRVGTAELAPTATVTVTVTKSDGTTVSKSATVGFYERDAEVGDYVYADGSYSAELDVTRGPIGICFYTNPENRKERLCMALKRLGTYAWGLYVSGVKNVMLQNYPTYKVYDVPTLVNKNGVNITAAEYRDETLAGDADGYKVLPVTNGASEIGFTAMDGARLGYEDKTRLPWGKINTLKIIEHRNKILTDPAVSLPVPADYDSLIAAMNDIVATNDNNAIYKQYYYPAASICHVWEPPVAIGVKLANRFKAGNWWLPSAGEYARIAWHFSQGVFANAISEGVMPAFPERIVSSTENSETNALFCIFETPPKIGLPPFYPNKGWTESFYPVTSF